MRCKARRRGPPCHHVHSPCRDATTTNQTGVCQAEGEAEIRTSGNPSETTVKTAEHEIKQGYGETLDPAPTQLASLIHVAA